MGKRKTQEQFLKQMKDINNNIEILGKYNRDNIKIKCRCKICNNIWESTPSNLLYGYGCKQCDSNNKRKLFAKSQAHFIKAVNEINENILVIGEYVNMNTCVLSQCKLCNNKFNLYPRTVYNQKHISCPVCYDGVSYPNKYVRNFLIQLPVKNLTYEWKPKWGKQYSYDNYFIYNNNEYVVEADGAQHFQKNKFGKFKPDEVQKRDKIKDELAHKNNIIVIRIDCQKSDPYYIKNKILESQLSSIFDLSCIDWEYCNTQSANSLIKQVCDLYNKGYKSIDIINKLKIDKCTIRKYLKIGNDIGWCNYKNKNNKEINVYDKKDINLLYSFDNLSNCVKFLSEKYKTDFNKKMITSVCGGYKKSYKGFIFKYT